MKRAIVVVSCFLLVGCNVTQRRYTREGPAPGAEFPLQDTAPLPWINILPSKRTMELEAVNYTAIVNRLRFNMDYSPYTNDFRNVSLILIDYAILPAEPFSKNYKIVYHNDTAFSKKFQTKPRRYVLTASFYDDCNTPPADPMFEETITLAVDKAPPEEAMRLMVDTLVMDHHSSSLSKIEVTLEAE
ncbi:MAG TPA: hypothetical protein VMW10_00305 [Alphaproteobacteria bacterium]|nr:hypothetical protein [Alphaproteobacteria bacterium]